MKSIIAFKIKENIDIQFQFMNTSFLILIFWEIKEYFKLKKKNYQIRSNRLELAYIEVHLWFIYH